MYFLRDEIDSLIIDSLDTETMALITEIKNRLGIPTYKDTIDIITTCTSKYKLEQLLLNLMTQEEGP